MTENYQSGEYLFPRTQYEWEDLEVSQPDDEEFWGSIDERVRDPRFQLYTIDIDGEIVPADK
tara:strand:- start:365 stop:550 length:186 start_codon:yes stop_codon:yes gene_type:complete